MSTGFTIAGKPVGPTGLGLMSLSIPPALDLDAASAVMKAALDHGANFWNGGVFYGTPDHNSLHLLRHYFTKYPEDAERVVLSIKGAYIYTRHEPDCSPEAVRRHVDEALAVLGGTKSIDIFQCARVDPKVPIEDTVAALAELVEEGKIGGIGLSEVSAATIRRAVKVHPIGAVEIELSLFTTNVLHDGVVDTCKELGIPVVAYGPLAKGWLTGRIRSIEDIPEGDYRRHHPRFQPAVFAQNLKLAEAVGRIAGRKGATPGQVAMAWVRAQGALPLPGTRRVAGVQENCSQVGLGQDDLREIQAILETMTAAGDRYPADHLKLLSQ